MMELNEHGSYTHTADPGEPGYTGAPKRISVTEQEAQILMSIAAGREVFEIGTGLGVATRAMAVTAVKVTTCDVDEWVFENIMPGLPSNVHYARRETIDTAVTDELMGAAFDLVFIDGWHNEAAVLGDIGLALNVLRRGGRIVLHDTKMDSVQAAIKQAGLHIITDFDTYYGLGIYEQ